MSDETSFLAAVAADRTDVPQLLVFGDWLEEQGDVRADFVRLDLPPRNQFLGAQYLHGDWNDQGYVAAYGAMYFGLWWSTSA